jgi:uncharacterized Tic20 family protein
VEGTTQSERSWAAICHLAAFAGLVIPFGNILGPLLIWLFKREESDLVDDQGKEALNFQISISIYLLAISVLTILFGFIFLITVAGGTPETGLPLGFGMLLLIVLLAAVIVLFAFVAVIVGAVRAGEGRYYRYPLSIKFIR